jgi:hypothetical protein
LSACASLTLWSGFFIALDLVAIVFLFILTT